MIYADYAAATPLDDRVLAAMQPYWQQRFYNPSALYQAGRDVRQAIESARRQVAAILGSRPAEIIFTAGGSEANNLAIHGVMRQFPDASIAVSAIEHDSVLKTAQQYRCDLLAVDEQGILQPLAVSDTTVLVSVMYANNEIGTLQPIRQLAASVATIRAGRQARGVTLPLYLHVDASQAANYLDLQVSRLGADLMTLNGGKIYGPKQSGALYVKAGIKLHPLISGGGQERGLRSGTENPAAIVGFATALQISHDMRHDEVRRLQTIQGAVYQLVEETMPSAVVHGSRTQRLPNNIHISLPGTDNERLLYQLDISGIMLSAGSACSAGNDDLEASHVLRALGLDAATARSSLRITFGRQTTADDAKLVIQKIAKLYRSV